MKPFCPECNGSGESNDQGYLDCAAPNCTAAEDRAHMEAHLNALGRLSNRDLLWEAYKCGQAKAGRADLAKCLVAEVVENDGKRFCMLVDWAALPVGTKVYTAAPANNNTETPDEPA